MAVFHNLPTGGANKIIYFVLKELSNSYKIDLYKFNSTPAIKDEEKICSNVYKYDLKIKNNFFHYLLQVYLVSPIIQKRISLTINKRKYKHILVTHDYLTKSPYLLRYLKQKKVYLCFEPLREFYESRKVHLTSIRSNIAYIFRYPIKFIDRSNIKYADKVLTISDFSKSNILRYYGIRAEKVRLGIDPKQFRIHKTKRQNILLSVGSISKLKGYDFLLNSLSKIDGIKKYKIVFVGNSDTYSGKLKKIAKKKGLNLVIEKNIPEDRLIRYYNRSMIFLYSPYKEPLGLAPLEAMACGLPVLAINDGGLKETITNQCGWLIDRDEDKFSIKLAELLNNRYLIEEKRLACSRYINSNWDINNNIKNFEKYL